MAAVNQDVVQQEQAQLRALFAGLSLASAAPMPSTPFALELLDRIHELNPNWSPGLVCRAVIVQRQLLADAGLSEATLIFKTLDNGNTVITTA